MERKEKGEEIRAETSNKHQVFNIALCLVVRAGVCFGDEKAQLQL